MTSQTTVKNNDRINFVKGLTNPPIARTLFGEVRWAWMGFQPTLSSIQPPKK